MTMGIAWRWWCFRSLRGRICIVERFVRFTCVLQGSVSISTYCLQVTSSQTYYLLWVALVAARRASCS